MSDMDDLDIEIEAAIARIELIAEDDDPDRRAMPYLYPITPRRENIRIDRPPLPLDTP